MSAPGTGRVLVNSSRLSAISEKVFAAAGFDVPAGAEHGDGIAEDVADVEVAAGVAFEDCTTTTADGNLALEGGAEACAACCGAAAAGPGEVYFVAGPLDFHPGTGAGATAAAG